MLLVAGSAVALAAASQQSDQSGSDAKSLEAQATKSTEGQRPTPTPVPPVSVCPVDLQACELAKSAANAIRAGNSNAFLNLAMATTLECTKNSAPATQPLCQFGATQTGYLTSSAARYGFFAGADFASFIEDSFESDDRVAVVSIGCPADAGGQRDCGQLVLIGVAPIDNAARIASGNNAPLVLVALRNQEGEFRIVAAQRGTADEPSFRGGSDIFSQFGVAWTGPVSFIPVRLPE